MCIRPLDVVNVVNQLQVKLVTKLRPSRQTESRLWKHQPKLRKACKSAYLSTLVHIRDCTWSRNASRDVRSPSSAVPRSSDTVGILLPRLDTALRKGGGSVTFFSALHLSVGPCTELDVL